MLLTRVFYVLWVAPAIDRRWQRTNQVPAVPKHDQPNVAVDPARVEGRLGVAANDGLGLLELDARDGSSAVLRRITMTRPPLHITAPDATVRIYDSVLQVGLPGSHAFIATITPSIDTAMHGLVDAAPYAACV